MLGDRSLQSPSKPLPQQIAEAIEDRGVPISRLLRLIWALEEHPDAANDDLRALLRARIGAPPVS